MSVPKTVYALAGLGGIRGFYKSGFVKKSVYDFEDKSIEKRPLLYSERLLISAFNSLVFVSPLIVFSLYNDAKRIETHIRSLNPKHYETTIRHEMDVIF